MFQRNKEQREATLDRIEQAVAAAEEKTSVEFVTVFVRQAGSYADVDLRLGLIFVTLTMLALLFLPFEFSPLALLIDLPIAFLFGWLLSRYLPSVRRLLTSAARRKRQARTQAEAMMTSQGMTLTVERTGLLVFVSWLERRCEVFADIGIERAVPRPEWNLAAAKIKRAAFAKDFPDSFLAALDETATLLGAYLPPSAENPNEIPNRPVML